YVDAMEPISPKGGSVIVGVFRTYSRPMDGKLNVFRFEHAPCELKANAKWMQETVGGHFEMMPHRSPENAEFDAYANEEGIPKNLRVNDLATGSLRNLGFY